MTSRKKNSNTKTSKDNNIFTDFDLSIKKSKKCNIKNTIGLIIPKDVDVFSCISNDNFRTEPKNTKKGFCELTPDKNIIRISIVPRTIKKELKPLDLYDSSNSISEKENKEPNIPQFKATLDFYREIDQDSKESIIPCKPMINSTSSKAFMYEYSKSKKYQEDKINFFSTMESSCEEQPRPYSNKNNFPSNDTQSPILEDLDDSRYDMEIDELLKYQESNLPVPLKKKDDENFKILTMKKMKRKTMPPNKSVRKFAEDIEPLYEKEFRIQNNFCNLLKRKVVHSTRRIYSSNFVLKKGKQSFDFMVFRDKDIGIYEYWQAHIHENQNDEDFDTDEEQKKLATCFTLGEIKEALTYVRDKSFEDCFINFNRYSKYRTEQENNYIKEQVSKLKENMEL